MRKAFEFVFGGGLEYCMDYIQRWGNSSSLLANISHYGIYGQDKSDLDIDKLVSTIIGASYAPYFFIIKNKTYKILYLWGNSKNGDDTLRIEMQSNSLWFFTILKELLPKGILIKTDVKRGYDVSSWIKKVSDIQICKNRHISGERAQPGSIYIRIKVTSSRYALYEIYNKYYSSVIKDLDLLGIDYKIVE